MPTACAWKITAAGSLPNSTEVKFNCEPSMLDKLSTQIPDGVYTTFRTFQHNKVLPLEAQFHRLEESASLLGTQISINRGLLRDALRTVTRFYQEDDMRIRLSVDLTDQIGTIYIAIEKLITPQLADYDNGVNTVTQRLDRNNPKAKQTAFLHDTKVFRSKVAADLNEILLIDCKGQILEGLSSNFLQLNRVRFGRQIKRYYPVLYDQ